MLFRLVSFIFSKAVTKCEELHFENRFKALRLALTALYGVAIGFLIFICSVAPFNFSIKISLAVVSAICVTCSVLCIFSLRFRCVSVLFWLEALGKAGRNFIKTLVFMLVLLGPVSNVIQNTKECGRVLECTAYLTYNLTKTKFDLAVKPFTNAFAKMNQNLSEAQTKLQDVRNIVQPIYEEIENKSRRRKKQLKNVKSPDFYKQSYSRKLKARCETVITSGKIKCEKALEKASLDCMEKTPVVVNYIVCAPLKIDFVCSLGKMFTSITNVCDPSDVVDSSFGSEYVKLKEKEELFAKKYGNVAVNYTTASAKAMKVVKSINATSRNVGEKLQEKAELVDRLSNFISKLMIFVYIKILYGKLS